MFKIKNSVHEVVRDTGYENKGDIINIYPTKVESIDNTLYEYVTDTGVLMTIGYYKEYFKRVEV